MLEPWTLIRGRCVKDHPGEQHHDDVVNDNELDNSSLLEPIEGCIGFNEYDEPTECSLLVPIEEND